MMNPPYQPNEVTAMMHGIQKYYVPLTPSKLFLFIRILNLPS